MKSPNYALALALAEAGWNNSETARRINALARERGYHGVAVDRSRVSRWIRQGERPRSPVPELLADLLTVHLNRLYTPSLLGVGPSRSVLIHLDPSEHRTLTIGAVTANMSVEHYAQVLVRMALLRTARTQRAGSRLAQLDENDLS
ncbi:hypothetical protein SHL15_4063 [Streptomyces hygroscopicus subsp. limoneus]|nr:hypothetical protein SHL15_4063 [Streptomyces hygroscopicus subsp. limoneus]